MSTLPAVPRPAATLILLREAARGPEVLMVCRTNAAQFAGGAYVFPGGALDPADHDAALGEHCVQLDDRAASTKLGIASGGLGYWMAAIRETFEEAGLLLAYDSMQGWLRLDRARGDTLREARLALSAGQINMLSVARAHRLRFATDQVHYFSHWITQAGRPRRFDTRFFLAQAPPDQHPAHDGTELVSHVWITPSEALERNRRGDFNMLFPTIKTLEALANHASVAAALTYAQTPRPMPAMEPRMASGRAGQRLLVPGDHAYAEVVKLDPEQSGQALYEITPGQPVRLSERVTRLTAPNPSVMTGPGTNTYFIGDANTGVAVVDPGPDLDVHLDAIVSTAPGPIRWILCTHTHRDHSPGSRALKARTGAHCFGMLAQHPDNQDDTFVPDSACQDGDVLAIAGCNLRVLHTPGHASNQLCFLLQEEKLLFTGDHIMQGSTVVINPPDGNMGHYMASLERLLREPLDWLAPGHGFLMARPHEMVERLLVHRRARENKVLNALRATDDATIESLLPVVYDDTPAKLHGWAARSLLAHLLKLETEGRVGRRGEHWRGLP